MRKVTGLEPRTPHQPEKLKKLSKNEVVYREFGFLSQRKCVICKRSVFKRVQRVHRGMTGFGAGGLRKVWAVPLSTRVCARGDCYLADRARRCMRLFVVKIRQMRCGARSLGRTTTKECGDSRPRLSVERSSTCSWAKARGAGQPGCARRTAEGGCPHRKPTLLSIR